MQHSIDQFANQERNNNSKKKKQTTTAGYEEAYQTESSKATRLVHTTSGIEIFEGGYFSSLSFASPAAHKQLNTKNQIQEELLKWPYTKSMI